MNPATRKRLVRTWKAFADQHAEEFEWESDDSDITGWTLRITRAFHRVHTTTLGVRYCQQLYISLGIDALDVDRDLMWELHPINIATADDDELKEHGFRIDKARRAELKAGGYLD